MKWLHTVVTIFIGITVHSVYSTSDPKKADLHNYKLPPCQSCKVLVTSFLNGMEKTSRGKFEGGDAAWEEEKMGSYATSEVRLIEIQENLCNDVEKGKYQCQGLAEENEALFEEWWKNQQELGDLQKWLCIEKLQTCCPDLHYGIDCTPCKGYPDNVCNNNGKCKGSGTRKGNGQCSCNIGYEGPFCDKCSDSYYQAYKDDSKLLCSPCHHSCQNACSQAGPKGCVACKTGWVMDTENGCLDINECIVNPGACNSHQFCVNNDGSYTCLECDKACRTCNGDGPDMCDECADGYYLKDKICIDSSRKSREMTMNFTRYLTYAGLTVATCIVFSKNVYVASFIGLSVGLYISISEYMLATGKASSDIDLDFPSLFKT